MIVGGDTDGLSACAIVGQGGVECWGWNGAGNLGIGTADNNAHPSPAAVPGISTAVALSGGGNNVCAVLANGTLQCWGSNGQGVMGNGTKGTGPFAPTTVSGLAGVQAASVGLNAACALTSNDSIDCWGVLPTVGVMVSASLVSESGFPNAAAISVGLGNQILCVLSSMATVSCVGEELGNLTTQGVPAITATPYAVPNLSQVTSLSVGNASACVVVSGGTVDCWGASYDSLGDGSGTPESATPAPVPGISTATTVSTGNNFACALLADTTVVCWGYNALGQLGGGSTVAFSGTPMAVQGLTGVTEVAAGWDAACARLTDGSVRCWGANTDGFLGTTTGPATCGSASCSRSPVTINGL
jgi:alpha-tubulin suppressor-like RCC1 family protein